MTGDLLDQVRRRTPELADEVLCGGPGDLKGERAAQLDLAPDEVPCPKGDKFNPAREDFGVRS